ncbi:MAG TPA: M67 family metallopeptidase [Puia sp.]|jgi:proteasome lid subunit RPN8/RPN11|nr:M67 family metallopeptidase [Puia sp.]
MIILEPHIRQLLAEDATNTFPDECCGFLFGREETDGTRIVLDILIVDNSKQGDKTRRFEISPVDYMTAEQHALDHDWTLLGVYHSHPKHPAIPSEHDRKAAQPYFSYVIVSVLEPSSTGQPSLLAQLSSPDQPAPQPEAPDALTPDRAGYSVTFRSWLLNEEQQFEEEKIIDYQFT